MENQNKHKITVVIPTRNRLNYLKQSLESVISQDITDMKIIVIDNAPDSDARDLVEEIGKGRVEYLRFESNTGIIGGWNRAIEACDTEYLSIFHDDDIMLPGFLAKSILALDNNPSAMMSYTQANKVDPELKFISIWSDLYPDEGLIKGRDYLMYTIEKGCCITIAPTVVLRKSVFNYTGKFVDELCYNSFDFNMWIKIASKFDLFFIKEVLVNYRLHEKQMSKKHWFTKGYPTGRLATMMELIKACCLLMQNRDIVSNETDRHLLESKLLEYNKLSSEYARSLIPGL